MSEPPHLCPPEGDHFPRRLRLSGAKQFEAVYAAKLRKRVGPLLVYGRPNGLPFSRLGMAVPRRVGNAVARVAVKRRLREAFRLHWRQWPQGFDWVINVNPHARLSVAEYAQLIERGARAIAKRSAKAK